MKHGKRWLALLLTPVLVLSLSACGGDTTAVNSSPPTLKMQVQSAIQSGDYLTAYQLLQDVDAETGDKDLLTIKENLVWMPAQYCFEGKTQAFTFDQGLVKTHITHYDDGGEEFIDTYTYNDRQQLIHVKTTHDGVYYSEVDYTYDERGNLLTREYLVTGGGWETDTYTYNQENRLLTRECLRSNNANEIYAYTYDEAGNILSEKFNDTITTYTYDEAGNMLTLTETFRGETTTHAYTYDENGNMTSRKSDYSYGDGAQVIYNYDQNGNCISVKETKKNGGWSKFTYTYTEQGQKATYRCIDSKGSDVLTTYTYDKNGKIASKAVDGEEDYAYTLTYDDYGNPLSCSYNNYDNPLFNYVLLTVSDWQLCYFPNGKPVYVSIPAYLKEQLANYLY